MTALPKASGKRVSRTEPPVHTRQAILAGESKVIELLHDMGFIDHGRSNWLQGTLEDGTEVVSNRKRYVLPDTALRATVGPRVTYIYRMIDDRPQIGESIPTMNIVKKPKLLSYVINLFLDGQR
jgi:hypothetical protein